MTISVEAIPVELKPRARSWSRTPIARLILVAAFTALLAGLRFGFWWQTGFLLALTSLFPNYRRHVLVLGALCWVMLMPPVDLAMLRELAPAHAASRWIVLWPLAVALVWVLAGIYLWIVLRFPQSPPGRHPLLYLILLLLALLALGSSALLNGAPWLLSAAAAMALGRYLWFFAYWIADNVAKRSRPSPLQTGYWRPFWGFTNVPFAKGPAYLQRIEARDDEQLAKVQRKGIKLLLWAAVLTCMVAALNRLLYGPGAPLNRQPQTAVDCLIPTYPMAIERHLAGNPYPLYLRWLAVIAYFVLAVVHIAIFGHTVIAICRMAGFDAPPNTDRPFSSTSIAEYYNRVYYYFKELLVTFFFYPAYFRFFKRYSRLRVFSATLAAAGLGNFLFHFLREDQAIFRLGLGRALVAFHPFAFYALLLGTGIALSQMRLMTGRPRQLGGARKILAIAGVLAFYCLISLIDDRNTGLGGVGGAGGVGGTGGAMTLADYGSFIASLFHP